MMKKFLSALTAVVILSTATTATAAPVIITLGGNAVGNSGVLSNELDASADILGGLLSIDINVGISGTVLADLEYTAGLLSSIELISADLQIDDIDAESNSFFGSQIFIDSSGVEGTLTSTAPNPAVSDGLLGGTAILDNSALTLDSGTLDLVGTGLASDVTTSVDLAVDPAAIDFNGLNVVATLSSDAQLFDITLTGDILTFIDILTDGAGLPDGITVTGPFNVNLNGAVTLVPEPTSGLFLAGLVGVGAAVRRRRK